MNDANKTCRHSVFSSTDGLFLKRVVEVFSFFFKRTCWMLPGLVTCIIQVLDIWSLEMSIIRWFSLSRENYSESVYVKRTDSLSSLLNLLYYHLYARINSSSECSICFLLHHPRHPLASWHFHWGWYTERDGYTSWTRTVLVNFPLPGLPGSCWRKS